MKSRGSKDLAKRNKVMNLFFKRKGIETPRRRSERIVEFEALKRGKPRKKYFSPAEIDRILLDNDIRPLQHSHLTSYDSLRTRKGLANYIGALENTNYTEQIINDEAKSNYENVLGFSEPIKQPILVDSRKRDYGQRAMQAITGAIETITDTTQQKPGLAY